MFLGRCFKSLWRLTRGTCRCKIMLGMNCEVWMITLVGKKGCNAVVALRVSCQQTQIMEGFWTIVLLVVAIDLEILFQSLVHSFSLSITFRMISGSEVKLHVKYAVPREWKKWDTNSILPSEVTWLGTPCLEKTCRTNNCASWGDVMVSWVSDEEWLLWEWSIMTKIEV